MKTSFRKKQSKGKGARQFNRQHQTTKGANITPTPMRGGIRL